MNERISAKSHAGLSVEAVFCPADAADPFDTVPWELRTAAIKGESGEVLFQQTGYEIPATWSQLATNVVANKYFYGKPGTAEQEKSVRQPVHRVCRTIADWGVADGYFASAADGNRYYRELVWLCLHQHASFNSPVWLNVGLFQQYGITGATYNWHWDKRTGEIVRAENPYEFPQSSTCFILSVEDDMEDIMGLSRGEAMFFNVGTGTDLSTLCSNRETIPDAEPTGLLPFMWTYDRIVAKVKLRRAATMWSIKDRHPDVMEFIEYRNCEEKKAKLLIEQGCEGQDADASAFSQNVRLSVRLSDDFMEAVETGKEWVTRWVSRPDKEGPGYSARDIFRRMAEAAWSCGNPDVQYDTTINRWHTCPNAGRINASTPRAECMFLDDSAFNLASVNLMKFRREDGTFDVARFQVACRLLFVAQEILVDHTSYPTRAIAANSHRYRPIGLGYSNLGSLIMASGLPYDSAEARGLCAVVTALLNGAACHTSTELAAAVGPFDDYERNRDAMLHVMEMHQEKVEEIRACPEYLQGAARAIWNGVLAHGARHGFRNAQATALAPAGMVSLMMDYDTPGIEPDISLVKYKQVAGDGIVKIVNQTVPLALRRLGYHEAEIESIVAYIDKEDMIEGAAELKVEHLPVFDCSFSPRSGMRLIPWRARMKMMAAAQPFVSGAISTTVNMPKDTTAEEVGEAYLEGWRLGLKALAIYREGSKEVRWRPRLS